VRGGAGFSGITSADGAIIKVDDRPIAVSLSAMSASNQGTFNA
jgi:hypothetical protein